MEIVITFLNNLTQMLNSLTPMQIIYASAGLCILGLIIIYRVVTVPKMRVRKVLESVRQRKYEQEARKLRLTHDKSFTWGENIDRTNIGTEYEVEEFSDFTDTRLREVMADVGK